MNTERGVRMTGSKVIGEDIDFMPAAREFIGDAIDADRRPGTGTRQLRQCGTCRSLDGLRRTHGHGVPVDRMLYTRVPQSQGMRARIA